MLIFTVDLTNTVLLYSYIGLGVFGTLLLIFIGLHIWWNRYQEKKSHIEHVGSNSIFRFIKLNIFAIFAAIWGCGLFSAVMALISLR
ncbi:hypothetical protein [Spiroplasma chrysopicola]|uniref:Transmembrane protein n=1 Tax=Spiroplasma chrysopicola DF-1 TaxID=1276227 RepID=R4UGG2_9MOLU|nr:hypothetical protein [Spiroplasma chrysopicola]AGM25205.1 hypothetical protein SCHRY_v1c06290 [Spiroplasma chrysopicola DF-1]